MPGGRDDDFTPDAFRIPGGEYTPTHCSCLGGGTQFGLFCLNERAPGFTLCSSCLEPRFYARPTDRALLCDCNCESCHQPPDPLTEPPEHSESSSGSSESHSSHSFDNSVVNAQGLEKSQPSNSFSCAFDHNLSSSHSLHIIHDRCDIRLVPWTHISICCFPQVSSSSPSCRKLLRNVDASSYLLPPGNNSEGLELHPRCDVEQEGMAMGGSDPTTSVFL